MQIEKLVKKRKCKGMTWAEAAKMVMEKFPKIPMTSKEIWYYIEKENLKDISSSLAPQASLSSVLHANSKGNDAMFYKVVGRSGLYGLLNGIPDGATVVEMDDDLEEDCEESKSRSHSFGNNDDSSSSSSSTNLTSINNTNALEKKKGKIMFVQLPSNFVFPIILLEYSPNDVSSLSNDINNNEIDDNNCQDGKDGNISEDETNVSTATAVTSTTTITSRTLISASADTKHSTNGSDTPLTIITPNSSSMMSNKVDDESKTFSDSNKIMNNDSNVSTSNDSNMNNNNKKSRKSSSVCIQSLNHYKKRKRKRALISTPSTELNTNNNCHNHNQHNKKKMQEILYNGDSQGTTDSQESTNSFTKSTVVTNAAVTTTIATSSNLEVTNEKNKLPGINNQGASSNMKSYLSNSVVSSSKMRKRSQKLSTAAQIQKSREGCVDLKTPNSFLVNINLKSLLNKHTFSMLPGHLQEELCTLLPACDQIFIDGAYKLANSTALSNEFFTKACMEWRERLQDGEFTSENQSKRKHDDKDPNKLDPWKEKHFETIWGEKLSDGPDLLNNSSLQEVQSTKRSSSISYTSSPTSSSSSSSLPPSSQFMTMNRTTGASSTLRATRPISLNLRSSTRLKLNEMKRSKKDELCGLATKTSNVVSYKDVVTTSTTSSSTSTTSSSKIISSSSALTSTAITNVNADSSFKSSQQTLLFNTYTENSVKSPKISVNLYDSTDIIDITDTHQSSNSSHSDNEDAFKTSIVKSESLIKSENDLNSLITPIDVCFSSLSSSLLMSTTKLLTVSSTTSSSIQCSLNSSSTSLQTLASGQTTMTTTMLAPVVSFDRQLDTSSKIENHHLSETLQSVKRPFTDLQLQTNTSQATKRFKNVSALPTTKEISTISTLTTQQHNKALTSSKDSKNDLSCSNFGMTKQSLVPVANSLPSSTHSSLPISSLSILSPSSISSLLKSSASSFTCQPNKSTPSSHRKMAPYVSPKPQTQTRTLAQIKAQNQAKRSAKNLTQHFKDSSLNTSFNNNITGSNNICDDEYNISSKIIELSSDSFQTTIITTTSNTNTTTIVNTTSIITATTSTTTNDTATTIANNNHHNYSTESVCQWNFQPGGRPIKLTEQEQSVDKIDLTGVHQIIDEVFISSERKDLLVDTKESRYGLFPSITVIDEDKSSNANLLSSNQFSTSTTTSISASMTAASFNAVITTASSSTVTITTSLSTITKASTTFITSLNTSTMSTFSVNLTLPIGMPPSFKFATSICLKEGQVVCTNSSAHLNAHNEWQTSTNFSKCPPTSYVASSSSQLISTLSLMTSTNFLTTSSSVTPKIALESSAMPSDATPSSSNTTTFSEKHSGIIESTAISLMTPSSSTSSISPTSSTMISRASTTLTTSFKESLTSKPAISFTSLTITSESVITSPSTLQAVASTLSTITSTVTTTSTLESLTKPIVLPKHKLKIVRVASPGGQVTYKVETCIIPIMSSESSFQIAPHESKPTVSATVVQLPTKTTNANSSVEINQELVFASSSSSSSFFSYSSAQAVTSSYVNKKSTNATMFNSISSKSSTFLSTSKYQHKNCHPKTATISSYFQNQTQFNNANNNLNNSKYQRSMNNNQSKITLKSYSELLMRNNLENSVDCTCNLKPFVICSKCGAFCHNECIGPSKICITCLIT